MNKLGVLAALTLVPTLLTGCDVHEKAIYSSTTTVPQTVTLRNIDTNEQLWSYDIPPGQQLQLWFTHPRSRANSIGYDEMVWTVGPIGSSAGPQNNRMRVPPPMSRRVEGTVRPPEVATKAPPPELTSPATP